MSISYLFHSIFCRDTFVHALVEMGALIKQDRGRYKVHPALMWRGQLMRRVKYEEGMPNLTLVDGGREDQFSPFSPHNHARLCGLYARRSTLHYLI